LLLNSLLHTYKFSPRLTYPEPLWEIPSEEFSDLIDINIKGVANIIRHFVPAMVKNKRGIIVNFSSGWGRSTSFWFYINQCNSDRNWLNVVQLRKFF
ncbi:MAG: SDR family NAD(P)-dependent oxidoreductase, partial [Nostoc sp. NMS7]|uniref:SDR family NAD(P)-dependent oxidoreductase n=1 Tax=Nostoc sp. NMS7 TaxID=2815391 RepID=UPI0025D97218